jgi:exodeoxyribonuclease V alpha subunit
MTRGRRSNTAHLIAENVGDARDQWIAVFARDRADLGPAHAAALAATEAARYALSPVPGPPIAPAGTARIPRSDAGARIPR